MGGIGSGKSSVVRHVDGLTLKVIGADKIGHDLLANPQVCSQIKDVFGQGVFSDPVTVNRSELAKRVFGNSPEHTEQLKQLNQILHPKIRQAIESEIRNVSGDVDAIILDAALLLEAGWDAQCDRLVFIDTPLELRVQRVQQNRNWSSAELAQREAAQMPVDQKKSFADYVVDNSGSLTTAAEQMEKFLRSFLKQYKDQSQHFGNA